MLGASSEVALAAEGSGVVGITVVAGSSGGAIVGFTETGSGGGGITTLLGSPSTPKTTGSSAGICRSVVSEEIGGFTMAGSTMTGSVYRDIAPAKLQDQRYNQTMSVTSLFAVCTAHSSHVEQVIAALQLLPEFASRDFANDPDFQLWNDDRDTENWESLKMENLREAQGKVLYVPLQSAKAVALFVRVDESKVEVQHALLKLVEEPPEHLQIVITASNKNRILPTLLSRMSALNDLKNWQSNNGSANLDREKIGLIYQYIKDDIKSDQITSILRFAETCKEKAQAQTALEELLRSTHEEYPHQTQEKMGKWLRIERELLQSLQFLSENPQINSRLLIEDTLLRII